ncbi:MAG: acyl-CoA thioesterase [Acidobacteria bacterium]|nr:acyl-CoA thioesterase [Acidobacteriota bacterium]
MRWIESPIIVRYSDTDQMGVVHNSIYACYFEQGRIDLCDQAGLPYHDLEKEGYFLMVAEMTLRYKAPVRYGEPISVRTAISKLNRRFMEFQYELIQRETGEIRTTGLSKHIVTLGTSKTISLPEPYYQKFLGLT